MTKIAARPTLAFALALALPFLASCARAAPELPAPARAYDVVIEGGRVVDGSGSPWFYGDVAIRGDRIARVAPAGTLRDARAASRIDARGMVVAPGFIDMQSHSRDAILTEDGRVISKVTQGVTTEIMGEGSTDAPLSAMMLAQAIARDSARRDQLESFAGAHGFAAWLDAMAARGASVNFGSYLGADNVREYAKGTAAGAPTPAELDTMRAVVRRAMEDGAFGLASALIYPPGNFATTAELVEAARAMAPYGGVYITHMRSEADDLLEAIDEAIRIGAAGGVPVEIYHLKAAGRANWPKAALAVAKIDSARAAGLDVQANMYPYTAGGTGLNSCIPPWAFADDRLYENLADSAMRARIRAEVIQPQGWESLCVQAGPEGVLVLQLRKPEHEQLVAKRLSEIAALQNKHWADVIIDLVLAERQRIGSIFFLMSEENLALQFRQPWLKFGTDASGWDPDSARGLVHPRSYGTFPRILGKYVRDEKVMLLEDAIRKMTSASATRLALDDRGLLKQGMYADVVVFDPATIRDNATYEAPHQLSTGIIHVFVNGTAVVRDGVHTGAKPGRALRGPGYREELK